MDINNNLILKKNKNYEDITSDVESIDIIEGAVSVVYKKSPDKTYTFNSNNIIYLKNPTIIDMSKSIIYYNNMPINGSALDFGEYVKIINNEGKSQIYNKIDIKINKSCIDNYNVKNIFNYFKDISFVLDRDCKKNDDDEENSDASTGPLSKQYNSIDKVDEKSVLGTYLSNSLIRKRSDKGVPIFPFGLNLSQKEAVNNALENQISIK